MASSEVRIPKLLTVPQLSERTGLAPWRIYELCAQGKLPHLRIGKTYRFAEDVVVQWIMVQSNKQAKPEKTR